MRLVAGLLVAAVVGYWLARRRFLVVTVNGDSMTPTLHHGDRVLVQRRTVAGLARGAVVVLQRPRDDGGWPPPSRARRRWMVKRVRALPGDPVPAQLGPALASLRGAVPAGRLVVLGDRAEGSFDSRYIGLVPADRLVGVVRYRLHAARSSPC
jgi:signal peptidase I